MNNGKIQTYDFKLIRNINDRIVLNMIRENKTISGADLARLSGMQPSTIWNIINGLKGRKLITLLGKGKSTQKGGKRPNLWKINGSAAYTIGLDVEIGQLAIAMLDLNGKVKYQKIFDSEGITNPDQLSQHMINGVHDVITKSKVMFDKILGCGVAIAGIVNRDTGRVIMTDIIHQMNFSLTAALQEHFQFPVVAENNANASAIGAKIVGRARGERNFMAVLIEVDTFIAGIGIGLVLNGEIYHGTTFSSGEITAEFPPLMNVFSRLLRAGIDQSKYLKKYVNNIEDIDIRVLIDAAKQGDMLAIHYFKLLGQMIGNSIARHIALINPSQVIISGEVAEVGELILRSINEVVETQLVKTGKKEYELRVSQSGRYSVAIGAASIILDEFLKVPNYSASQIVNLDSHL